MIEKTIVVLLALLFVPMSSAEIIPCDNCTDCNEKIQCANTGDVVRLTADITNRDRTCIDLNGTSGITFDGGGHTISGIRASQSYGIYLPTQSGINTITNCTITDFHSGIYVFNSMYTTIRNITSYDNRDTGITIFYSTGCTVKDCSLQENAHYDFYFRPNSIDDCTTTVSNVIGSGNRTIALYYQNTTISDMEFSALYLCNADNSTLNNVTVRGSDCRVNNGMRLYYTDNAIIENITSSDNAEGIELWRSSNNTITGGEFSYNPQHGVFISYGGFNVFENVNTISNTQAGIYVIDSESNTLRAITSSGATYFGIVLDRGSNNTITESHITNSLISGLKLRNAANNPIYNNYFGNANNIDFAATTEYHNVWNVTPTSGENIIGGQMIGGNYWNDYAGIDTNGDGFGDEPHNISQSGLNIDHHPLVVPLCGDVDCNGYISSNDVIETYRRAVDPDYPLLSEWAADADGNRYILSNDVVEIYRAAVDHNHPLNCTELE